MQEIPMNATQDVIEHHLNAFSEQDLDAIMDEYDETSVIITDTGTYRGHDEIASLFEELFADFSPSSSEMELHHLEIDGEVAHIVWDGKTPDNVYEFATDTFVIRDGIIVTQTFAGKIEPND